MDDNFDFIKREQERAAEQSSRAAQDHARETERASKAVALSNNLLAYTAHKGITDVRQNLQGAKVILARTDRSLVIEVLDGEKYKLERKPLGLAQALREDSLDTTTMMDAVSAWLSKKN